MRHIAQASAKNKFNARLTQATPENPSGFVGGMSTEKYVAASGVSRATAYRELTDLVAQGLLTVSGQGRGTRYVLLW